MGRAWADQSLLERMVSAVERVRDRLVRAALALESAGVPYAVVGGNAVAAWVATVDPGAVRNTQDVDVLLRRCDLEAATKALSASGFIHTQVAGIEMFLDGPTATPRNAVHVILAGEKVREDDSRPAPDLAETAQSETFRVISLEALLRMKLTAFRLKDRVHVLDMLEVGLIDATWKPRLSPDLAERLQTLIDNPQA